MPFTVDEANAALANAQANARLNPRVRFQIDTMLWFTDTRGWTEIAFGPLYGGRDVAVLGSLGSPSFQPDAPAFLRWYLDLPPWFHLGLDIEPVMAIGRFSLRPPAFAQSFLQRHGLLSSKRYRGVMWFRRQVGRESEMEPAGPRFTVTLTEDPVNLQLTGTITECPPGSIQPPATIGVVLHTLGIRWTP